MDPIALEAEDVAFFPPHRLEVKGALQPQYRPLPTAVLEGKQGRTISKWTFSAGERARIAAGEDLFIQQLTFGDPLQPILPTVGTPDFCSADDI